MLADCNAQPPLGIGGVEVMDKAKERHGKIVIGALGLGGLKLKLHRECVGKLFEQRRPGVRLRKHLRPSQRTGLMSDERED